MGKRLIGSHTVTYLIIEPTNFGSGSGSGGISPQMAFQSSGSSKQSLREGSSISITHECAAHSLGARL